jgi:hypothetical protein
MSAPQICVSLLLGASVLVNLLRHGEPKVEAYDFPTALVNALIWYTLLRLGGFF